MNEYIKKIESEEPLLKAWGKLHSIQEIIDDTSKLPTVKISEIERLLNEEE